MSDTKLTGFYFPWPNLGVKLSRQWEKLRDNTEKEAPLIRAAYVDAQPSSANDPGNHDLSGWAIGERDFRNRFRIWYDKTNDRFSIQYNSGTEAVEVWDDYLSIRQVDGRVTVHGYGGLDSAAGGFYTTVPRNLAISRTFTPAAREWVFDHNLDTKPILWNAFNLEDKSVTPTTVDVSNPNIAYFYFPALQAGRAIVVAEQARGEGIRITDGVNVFPAANRLSFNRHDFYLSKEGHGAPVVNLQPIDLSGTQHGNLGALTADDHPQYARTDGTRTITGDQRFASDIVVEDKATAGSFYSPTFGEVAYANQGYLSVTQTNGSPLFSTVNSLKFEHQNFYLTADSDGKPIVNFRGVGGGSGGGQFGTGLESESFSSSTQWAFNHGLGTANVIWSVYDNQGYAVIPDKVSTHDPNIAYFYFSPATAGKVVIAGGPLVNTITVKGNTGAAWNRSTDTLNFNPAHFYITATATGKPIINAQPSAGGGVTDHGALTGLLDDDHSQYSLASGSRAFTGTVGGISPTAAAHLATKGYVDIRFSNFYNDLGGVSDHGALTGLADDDHSQYLLASDATNRATFAANWTDLTDGNATSLHTHAGLAATVMVKETDGTPPTITADSIIFNSSTFYINADSGGDAVINIRPSGIFTPGVIDFAHLSQNARNVTSDLAIGCTLHKTDFNITSDGATITATLTDDSGEGIQVLFFSGITTVAASGGSIAATLTAGTDSSPQANYCYILPATPTTLTVSTTGYPDAPTVEHIKVGYVLVQSAATVQSYGPLIADSTPDTVHYDHGSSTGHLAHINEWIKHQPATWKSGVAPTETINTGATPDTVTFATASGIVYQIHPRTFPAIADPAPLYVVNHPSGAYTRVTTMPGLTSGGAAIGGGDRIIVVLWGAINDNESDCKLFLNLPSGYYGSNAAAIADDSKYGNYTIPNAFKGTGFLIASWIFQYTTTSGGTYTLVQETDLRGLSPSSFPGGSTAAGTEFTDSAFRINDNSDATKQVAFEVSGVSASTTRTLTVQNRSGTIALTDQLSGDFYHLTVGETDGNPPAFRSKSLLFNSSSFYLTSNSLGKPIVNFRGSAGTGTALTVKDIDGNPTVSNVSTIQFTNGSVTDQGGGVAQVTLGGGSGISTLTEGSKSFGSQTTLGFNSHHFYLSPGGTAGSKVLNLRYSKEIIPVFQELVTVSNFAIDPFVPYPYTIETVDIDCKSGSCVAAFYILAANARNKNGKSIVGLDPIAVSTSVARKVATANNSVNPGDCLMLSIPSNTTAKHLRISITAKKPN